MAKTKKAEAVLTRTEALAKWEELRAWGGATRSQVCSFVNELEHARLITGATAENAADVLNASRFNVNPVLSMLRRYLRAEGNE